MNSTLQKGVVGFGLRTLSRLGALPALDRLGLRKSAEKAVYRAARGGFRVAGAANRAFKATQKLVGPQRPTKRPPAELFDITPSEEQAMLRDAAAAFAGEQLRAVAADADSACAAPADLLKQSADLGIALLTIPEALGGAGNERSAVTGVLVAEALAQGDMGLAVACLAPAAVSQALVLWGDETQQATYLPSFVGEHPPAAALALLEPQPLFDPFALQTIAKASGDGYLLSGVKALVPGAATAELFVIAARLDDGRPGLFLVESSAQGLSVEAEPAMGLRAAATGRLHLDKVRLPASALLGGGDPGVYADCVALGRLGWCALAVGTSQAVLDYVVPYVNERVAFGEPISHRQAVAFTVADIAVELNGMRLATYRAASRAEQGRSFRRELALARRLCADKGMAIGSNGVQLLGGHGFIKEHPVERWYRDLRACAVMEGALLV
jgi:alkylation response protein AidB-like acyl-CoA dehydrogenase